MWFCRHILSDMDGPVYCRLMLIFILRITDVFGGKRECDDNQIFTDNSGVKRCYVIHVPSSKIRGDEVQQTCSSLGGKAAALDTTEKINFISSRPKAWFSGKKDKYWIGAQGRWAWLGTKTEPTYTNWFAQSETKEHEEYCACLLDQTWKSEECDDSYGFICETSASSQGTCPAGYTTNNGGSCLKVSTSKEKYEKAAEFCANDGGHLAKLDTQEKNQHIIARISSATNCFWFGLDRVYTWFWSDTGALVLADTALWKSGEPSDDWKKSCAVKAEHKDNDDDEWKAEKCDDEEEAVMCEHVPCIKDDDTKAILFKTRYRNKKLIINNTSTKRVRRKARSPMECVSSCLTLYPCDCIAVEYHWKTDLTCTLIVGDMEITSNSISPAMDIDIYAP